MNEEGRLRRLPVDVWFEPLVIVVVAAVFVTWYTLTEFTANELAQLEWSVLATTIRAHIELTVTAAVIVLVIAIPLGVILTRPRLSG